MPSEGSGEAMASPSCSDSVEHAAYLTLTVEHARLPTGFSVEGGGSHPRTPGFPYVAGFDSTGDSAP